jgi:hypothetical protein
MLCGSPCVSVMTRNVLSPKAITASVEKVVGGGLPEPHDGGQRDPDQ